MAEKRLNVRYASTGGREIKREMEGLGEAGEQAFRGIGQRAREMQQAVQDSLGRASRAVGMLGAAVSVASGAVTLAVRGQVQAAAEIGRLSAVSNTGAEDFQRFAFAAESVGIEQDKLADILKDVNDRVGDFLTTGGGPMADFFEKIAPQVGVTAEQFRNLSGADALQLFVSSLERANLSQEEMTFFMEAMASDATALIPLLRENGSELDRLGAAANVFSDDTITGARKFNENIAALTESFQQLLGSITEALLPGLIELSERGVAMAESFRGLPPEAVEWFAKLAGIVAVGGPLLLGLSAVLGAAAALVSPFGLAVIAISGVVGALVKFWPELMAAKDRIVEFVADAGDAFWAMKESIAQAVTDAVTWVREQFAALVDWFVELPARMVEIGGDIIDGLLVGIQAKAGELRSYITDLGANLLPGWLRAAAETQSPSRVFARIGRDLVDGLTVGIEENVAGPLGQLTSLSDSMSSSFQSAFMGIVSGSKSARDAIGSLLQDLAKLLAQRAFSGLWGALFPSAAPAPPSFAGGGFTGNRPRTGGLDGQGGFLAMLHPQETVVDHTRRGRSEPASSIVINIDARGSVEGEAERFASFIPEIERRVIGGVQDRMARGRM